MIPMASRFTPAMEATRFVEFGKVERRRDPLTEKLKTEVEGKWLWVELLGGELESTPEAWASFGLYPAMKRGCGILLRGQVPPDKTWSGNAVKLMAKMIAWWGGAVPAVTARQRPSWRRRLGLERRGSKRLLFFSGGVDSFHALNEMIRLGKPPDALLFVEGFDIDLADTGKSEAYLPALEEICRHHKLKLLRVRINLRKMPFFTPYNWQHTHGLAMAGVAHLIRGYGEIYIASSFETDRDIPYGSRKDLDVFFNSRLKQFYHVGYGILRTTKLADMSDDVLVQRHLRVCWKGRGARKNCGECEKCLRTELNVLATGRHDQFTCFDHPDPLAARFDKLSCGWDPLIRMWQAAKVHSLPPDLERAVKEMLLRSLERLGGVPKDLASERAEIMAVLDYCGYSGELMFES